jgi:SpoVK/Ycf46/Vps4 family AAA+-type ATPase
VIALGDATARRQDLLFELEVEFDKLAESESLKEKVKEIYELDRRLKEVLSTVSHVCEQVRPRKTPAIYGSNGRLRSRRY